MNNRTISPRTLVDVRCGVMLVAMVVFLGEAWPIFADDAHSVQASNSEPQRMDDCGGAEECFAAAVWPKERSGNALSKDQLAALKLERLRQVTERFPASLWAKRAGLLSGVILIEQNPTSALTYLRAAQRDFPVLDDYIRFWIGEALLHQGDAKEAAVTFEAVPQTVLDTNLLPPVMLRAGEAWYQAGSCPEAVSSLTKAITLNDKEPRVPKAWLWLADCYLRDGRHADSREMLKKLWTKFPQTKEAKEAESILAGGVGGELWTPLPGDFYGRAQVFLGQALHAEAIEDLKKLLATNPAPPLRSEAKLKLGIAQVRLKLYDQARDTFQELAGERSGQSDEAAVWLARVYLRQGLGERLLELSRGVSKRSVSNEQKGLINLFAGIWLEDQGQFDEAIAKYRQVAKSGEPASQRTEAQWRAGWVLYRVSRYQEAITAWQSIVDQRDGEWEPQALYWIARSHGHADRLKSRDMYQLLCKRYPYTYYCQLAQRQTENVASIPAGADPVQEKVGAAIPVSSSISDAASPTEQNGDRRSEIERQPAYQRAIELRTLGLEQDAARELAALTDRYGRVPQALSALSILLNEAGAYNNALRLVRTQFRHQLERTGGDMTDGLWHVAYPMGLVQTIKTQGLEGVDPFLVAAIIREESQYDWRAVSPVGAIGLMQLMPATANTVAQRYRLPTVTREDLFDQETNIRIGVRYVGQLLTQFSGNVMQAVAAYNAGPMAVESWATVNRGRSEDEFVELIPYRETRQYVKRVLRSYKEYVRLANLAKPVS